MSIAPGLEHLPALPVVIPMIAAPVALLMRPGTTPWLWASIVSWVTLICTIMLLDQVWHSGPIVYEMGGWAAPLGITYYIDLANALVMLLVAAMASVVFPYARTSVEAEIDRRQIPAFYTALLICMTGLLGVAATGDAFNVFVFLEISSLSTYALVAMGARKDRRALTAAFNYLIMGTIGATFYVIGLGLLYQSTGTLNLLDLHEQLANQENKVVEAGFAFIVTGIGLKLAMVPLHLWLPNAYCFAPSAISAFLAATATKVQIYLMLRYVFTVFGFEFPFLEVALNAFLILGITGMFYASIVAVFRDNVKQMLAYSSIAQIGYMLLGISFGTVDGVAASLIHVFNHGLMKAALFMGVGCVVLRLGSSHFHAFKGLAKRMPWTAWGLILSGLSLVGVPPTVGFISKFQLMEAAFQTSTFISPLLVVLLIGASSLLAAVYIGRLIYAMVLEQPPEGAEKITEAPYTMRAALWLMVIANFYFFFHTDLTVDVAHQAAESLICTSAGCGGAY
ncbi:MAG: monovalent cation/H+ antiporter subunit D family protein [Aquisalinus sp.]|nr:monovalent cation/H+ antiporter subunit D family protein [Aquisalinus sp.]